MTTEAEHRDQRRLAAILAADMAGFSRLMEADEPGTIARQRRYRADLIDGKIAAYDGRLVKTTGDGLLVEFPSVVDAVECAAAIQRAMNEREADTPPDRRIQYRIGINLGDIVVAEDGDVFGDGVNVAARIEALCEPGGLSVSDVVYQSVVGKLDLAFDDGGLQAVKNLKKPVHVWNWRADPAPEAARDSPSPDLSLEQEIRFCAAADGTQIAYATVGQGPPLVKAPNWMTHLEYDWQSPIWRHLLTELAQDHRLVRFDQRANGLSDWDAEDVSFDAFVADLESVVDSLELPRFSLLGISQGCPISVSYAVHHPERVSRMVLYGGFARGPFHRGPAAREQAEAMLTLIKLGWGADNPAFRQMFTSSFLPDGTPEQMEWFNELQRISASAQNAARIRYAVSNINVAELLPRVTVPTLVLHCRDDGIVPFEEGRRMAAMIPGARFVALESRNHLILEHEPAFQRFVEEVREFLKDDA